MDWSKLPYTSLLFRSKAPSIHRKTKGANTHQLAFIFLLFALIIVSALMVNAIYVMTNVQKLMGTITKVQCYYDSMIGLYNCLVSIDLGNLGNVTMSEYRSQPVNIGDKIEVNYGTVFHTIAFDTDKPKEWWWSLVVTIICAILSVVIASTMAYF